jgi:sugar transferase EpsL
MRKRLFDIFFSIVGLTILSPVLLTTALFVFFKLGSPIIFTQSRPGLNKKPFKIFKFRSMSEKLNADGADRPDSARMSSFGHRLRMTSLDELPELWNVLKGDMSLVGPRPLLIEYLPLYTPEQARRHDVRPGITGWAQVNGRNALSWEEKFALDVWYVDNCSFLLDIKILWLTILTVSRPRDVNQPGHVTMEPFQGTKN